MKTKRHSSRPRDEHTVTPKIYLRRVNRCRNCGAAKEGYEFILMDEQPGERAASSDELMKYGFHVSPHSVDLVASLIGQQVDKWNGRTSSIAGVDVASSYLPPKVGSSAIGSRTHGSVLVKKTRRPKS